MITNQEFLKIFEEFADILELKKEIPFKSIAYQKVSRVISDLSKPLYEIYEEGGVKALEDVEGIGEGIAQKIEEYIKTGKIKELEKLRKQVPSKQIEFLKIPGVGPTTAKVLYNKYGNTSVSKLATNLSRTGEKYFKPKTLQRILNGIEIYKNLGDRMMIDEADNLAKPIIKFLEKSCFAQNVTAVGSLRRRKDTIGDLDFVAISANPKKTIECFGKYSGFSRILGKGDTKLTAILTSGKEVDLEILPKNKFGSLLLHFTGSKSHNVHLRSIAQQKGLSLSEHGLVDLKTNKLILCAQEKDIYERLKMDFIPPELREDRGEIEVAAKHGLPKIIRLEDIKGDLHIHSNWSDGLSTVNSVAKEASELGYEYLAIADHVAEIKNDKSFPKNIDQRKREIDEASNLQNIKIFNAIEVSIKENGTLELEDKYLSKFDFIIGSIHSHFDLSKEEQTQRLIRAIENKYVRVIGHPSTRKINLRPPIDFDWEKVFKACVKNTVALEINASPIRLDLMDNLVFDAKKIGVKFLINTDAHSSENLEIIEYGVSVARRGWCEQRDILNSLTLKEFRKWLDS